MVGGLNRLLVAVVAVLLLISFVANISALTQQKMGAPSLLRPGDSIKYWIEQNATFNMAVTSPPSYTNLSFGVAGTVEARVAAVNQEQITLNITCDLRIAGKINASDVSNEISMREVLANLERTLAQNCSQGVVVKVPYEAVLSFSQLFNGTPAYLVGDLSEFLKDMGISYNLTVDEDVYEGRPAIRVSLRASSNFSSANTYVNVESVGIFDQVTGIPFYEQLNVSATYAVTMGETAVYSESSVKYVAKILDASLLSSLKTKAYQAKSPSGELDIIVSGGSLEVRDISSTGNKVVIRVAGDGLGYVVVKLPSDVSVVEARVDERPVKHFELSLSRERAKIVKVPVSMSEHSVELVLNTEIQGLTEVSAEFPEAGRSLLQGNTLLLAGAALAVLAVVVAVLILRRSRRSSPAPA